MKKYYFIAALVILAGFYSYHFLAAEKAEEQIDEAIQEQLNQQPDSLSIKYSKIDISPFSGNITFKDLNVINSSYIQRAQKLTFDLTYWDFLSIYISGAEAGLSKDGLFRLVAENVSFLQRQTLQETKIRTLEATYSGDLWKTIQSMAMQIPLQETQEIALHASSLRYTQPESAIGSLKSDSLDATIQIIQNGSSFRSQTETRLSVITWTPPANFQQQYEFFIKGFGFEPDSIPIENANFSADFNSANKSITLNNSTISMSLAEINLLGNGIWATTISNTKVDTLSIRASKLSNQLQNILNNAEQLLGVRLPKEGNEIVIKLSGNLGSLKVVE